MIGTSLGPYKIIEQIGAGGMGEVYLGEDTRLGRKVAIKVLPEEYASDPERLARFEQEARAAAALNHPHIAVVHDIGTEGDIHFMVQEYLEGQSLRERLEKGALPLDKALDLATEVGEALIAAHKAGIIHRDLKPDNIFVTEEGHAKVLDFGLAKLTEAIAPTGSAASMSPTMLGTVAGQVMGTAGYMAPEQINGEEIDRRADLFAFGCVLYEMVSGRRAFVGDNVHETLGKILSGQPQPVHEARDGLPLKLGWIVHKALAKEPGRRYQTAGDVVVDLSQLQEDVVTGVAQTAAVMPAGERRVIARSSSQLKVLAGAVAAMLFIGTSYTIWLANRPAPSHPVVAFQLDLPQGSWFSAPGRRLLTISPDGAYLVFNAAGQLWRRPLDDLKEATPIRGTEDGVTPFFNPDSSQLGFFSGGELKVVPIAGGAVTMVCAVDTPLGASWAEDDTIFFGRATGDIARVPAAGGEPVVVVRMNEGEAASGPQLLPGGEWLLFTTRGDVPWNDAQIVVQSLRDGERIPLIFGGTDGRYVPTGHIVYAHDGELMAVAFDPIRLQISGQPIAVGRQVEQSNGGSAHYGISAGGTLAYPPPFQGRLTRLVWISRDGEVVEPIIQEYLGERLEHPVLSSDGERVAVIRDGDVWVYHLDGRPEIKVTQDGDLSNPLWTPDDTGLVYEQTGGDMFRVGAKATGEEPRAIGPDAGHNHPMSWDADGLLIFVDAATAGNASILRVELGGEAEPQDLLRRSYSDGAAGVAVSPDGRRMAFVSDFTGANEVWVMPYPDGPPARVSSGGGAFPVWAHDSSELYYVSGNAMMRVTFDDTVFAEDTLFAFPGRFARGRQAPNYDVAADGRFVMIEEDPSVSVGEQRINVILNWFEELKRLVPTGGRR